jgi:hypothetical protein
VTTSEKELVPPAVIESIRILGEWADKHALVVGPWLSIHDGELLFNNEYAIDGKDAVQIALVLLGFAKRTGRLEP